MLNSFYNVVHDSEDNCDNSLSRFDSQLSGKVDICRRSIHRKFSTISKFSSNFATICQLTFRSNKDIDA